MVGDGLAGQVQLDGSVVDGPLAGALDLDEPPDYGQLVQLDQAPAQAVAGAALLGVIAFLLSRRFLSKESIILSSKGKWA